MQTQKVEVYEEESGLIYLSGLIDNLVSGDVSAIPSILHVITGVGEGGPCLQTSIPYLLHIVLVLYDLTTHLIKSNVLFV